MTPLKRIKIPGPVLVFITASVNGWKKAFDRPDCADLFLRTLKDNLEIYSVSALAYILMPSHFHSILGFSKSEVMPPFMQALKSISSRKLNRVFSAKDLAFFTSHGSYRLWQPRFDDVILATQKQFEIKLNYIHNNPVKAGLVQTAKDWPFSSANDWLGEKNQYIPIDKEFKWLS